MKKYIILVALVLSMLTCAGASSENIKTEAADMDARQYMMDTFNLTEAELDGIDVQSLMDDYRIPELDYSPEEIREILRDQGDYYHDDGSAAIYGFISTEEGGTAQDESMIKRIGYYRHEGSLARNAVFDIENKVYYNGSLEANPLTDEQLAALSGMYSSHDMAAWEAYTSGEEQPTTGSFRWRIVFEYQDGTCCAYGGYTCDGSHLPDNFMAVDGMLMSIMNSTAQVD